MSDELEILEAASVSALASDKTGDGYLNGPCPNCSTEIIGNFCFNCGQSARDLKRPFFSLIRDMLGDLFSFDGRVWKTIPSLMFRPGKVTRSYIDGQRMRFVPPFRLFLIASLFFPRSIWHHPETKLDARQRFKLQFRQRIHWDRYYR